MTHHFEHFYHYSVLLLCVALHYVIVIAFYMHGCDSVLEAVFLPWSFSWFCLPVGLFGNLCFCEIFGERPMDVSDKISRS